MEILVVIFIVMLLFALTLPALDRARQQARGVTCISNLRQFAVSWTLYTDDHSDRLPPNCSFHDGNPGPSADNAWVQGWLDAETFTADNTNTTFLRQSHLWPYQQSLEIWRCPSDRSVTRVAERSAPLRRVRTVAMNKWLNCPRPWEADAGGGQFRAARRFGELRAPDPEHTWVFVDEREDSINDGHFVVNMHARGPAAKLVDFPGSYHNGGASLAFADGHAERKRWKDPPHPTANRSRAEPGVKHRLAGEPRCRVAPGAHHGPRPVNVTPLAALADGRSPASTSSREGLGPGFLRIVSERDGARH